MAKKSKSMISGGGGNSEHEGHRIGAGMFAGMPTEVKMQAYPKPMEYGPTDLDDTISEIDGANSRARSKSRSHVSDQH